MALFSKWICRSATGAAVLSLAMIAGGCKTSSEETAQRDALMDNVGKFDPAPAGIVKPRVGVPQFNVEAGKGFSGGGGDLNDLAADQMTTLLHATDRFDVIERAQLNQLLKEQDMEGIVKPGEMAKRGQVRGVDYLLLGKVTNLRVKREDKTTGFGLAQVGGFFNAGGGDYKKTETIITTEAGVDIRLVNPTDGTLAWSSTTDFKKTDAASAMGVDILGASAQADAKIEIDEDSKGKILRLALDDAIKKKLKDMDKFLKSREVKSTDAAPAAKPAAKPAAAAPSAPANTNSAAPAAAGKQKFCPECGTAVAAEAKFCPKDGKPL